MVLMAVGFLMFFGGLLYMSVEEVLVAVKGVGIGVLGLIKLSYIFK